MDVGVSVCVCSCRTSQQNSLVLMTLNLLFEVLTVAVECNAEVFLHHVVLSCDLIQDQGGILSELCACCNTH